MRLVYVARHGETDWNGAGRYQGRRESQLTALGRQQAMALAEELAPRDLERVVASPLSRCRQTAAVVAERAGVVLETDGRLVEIAHGSWEGRLREEIERSDAARMRAWRESPQTVAFPGGESLQDVLGRWCEFARGLEVRRSVAVVTHDVLVRIAILWAGRRPISELWQPRVHNGGYAVFEPEGDPWRLVRECCESHLGAGLLADTSRQAL
ncbi:MAG TPA: histidine phosphatase family protein [Candidatus Acidoferrales bacterium]|nr:histidine phosphatase family protein [Candidatus Acidoferrales bacterium]